MKPLGFGSLWLLSLCRGSGVLVALQPCMCRASFTMASHVVRNRYYLSVCALLLMKNEGLGVFWPVGALSSGEH